MSLIVHWRLNVIEIVIKIWIKNKNTTRTNWLFFFTFFSHFSGVRFFFHSSCAKKQKKKELEQPLWLQRSGAASWCRSERQGFFLLLLLPLRAAWGLFPHSGGWPAWCVSWVWPLVPCSNGQNLQNQHAQLDKVGRIIRLSLVWGPLEGGRGLELFVALHQHLFIVFCLLAFAPWGK